MLVATRSCGKRQPAVGARDRRWLGCRTRRSLQRAWRLGEAASSVREPMHWAVAAQAALLRKRPSTISVGEPALRSVWAAVMLASRSHLRITSERIVVVTFSWADQSCKRQIAAIRNTPPLDIVEVSLLHFIVFATDMEPGKNVILICTCVAAIRALRVQRQYKKHANNI